MSLLQADAMGTYSSVLDPLNGKLLVIKEREC